MIFLRAEELKLRNLPGPPDDLSSPHDHEDAQKIYDITMSNDNISPLFNQFNISQTGSGAVSRSNNIRQDAKYSKSEVEVLRFEIIRFTYSLSCYIFCIL